MPATNELAEPQLASHAVQVVKRVSQLGRPWESTGASSTGGMHGKATQRQLPEAAALAEALHC